MSLPRIQETDAWLEEDEECCNTCNNLLRTKNKIRETHINVVAASLTCTVTKFAKISVYSYLLFKLFSKYPFARIALVSLMRFFEEYKGISSVIAFALLTFLGTLKLSTRNFI